MNKWIDVDDDVKIPYSKLCVSDGINIFFARVIDIVINQNGRKVNFEVFNLPDNYKDFKISHWVKLELPN